MCVVCTLWERGKLTVREADRAIQELVSEEFGSMYNIPDSHHFWDVLQAVERKKQDEFTKSQDCSADGHGD